MQKLVGRTVVLIGLCLLAAAASALPFGAEAKHRADDAGIWHWRDNPAMQAFSGIALAAGARTANVDASGIPLGLDSLFGADSPWELMLASPLAYYSYSAANGAMRHEAGSSFALGPSLALGYSYAWGEGLEGEHDAGLIVRPFDFLSLAMTNDAIGSAEYSTGLGVALRPLAFIKGLGPELSLSADARVSSAGFVMENASLALALKDIGMARAYYDFERERFGAEISLSLGGASLSAAAPSLSDPSELRLGASLAIPMPGRGSALASLSKILYYKDLGMPSADPLSLASLGKALDARALAAELTAAAKDSSVRGLVVEGVASLGGTAALQELATALDEFKAAGKKFEAYVDYVSDFELYAYFLSKADRLVLDPNGEMSIGDYARRKLFYKGFLDKLGIETKSFAVAETKSASNSFTYEGMPEGERAQEERLVARWREQSTKALDEGRAGRLKLKASEVLEKAPWLIAGKALESGLVDELGYRGDFIEGVEKAYNGAVRVASVRQSKDTWGPSVIAKKVAIVKLSGSIIDGYGVKGSSIGYDTPAAIRALADEPSIGAIILRVDSGGGSAFTSDAILHEARRAQEKGKLIVVSMGDVAASGGYWVSAYADRIFAMPGTITGSIGVTSMRFTIAPLLEKLGLRYEGPEASAGSSYFDILAPFASDDAALQAEWIDLCYQRFIDLVAEGRGIGRDKVAAMAEGQVWFGTEALEKGLVDELGDLESAMAWVEEELGGWAEYSVVEPGRIDPTGGLLGGLLQAGAKAAMDERPELSMAQVILSPLAPIGKQLKALAAMRQGPLAICEEAFFIE
jgi:protease-4